MGRIAGKIMGFLPGSHVKAVPLTSSNNGGVGKGPAGMLTDILHSSVPTMNAAWVELADAAMFPNEAHPVATLKTMGEPRPAVHRTRRTDGR